MKRLLEHPNKPCEGFKEVELCSLRHVYSEKFNLFTYQFNCGTARNLCSKVETGLFVEAVAKLVWTSVDLNRLEMELEALYWSLKKTKVFFIRCRLSSTKRNVQLTKDGYVQQLLWFLLKPAGNKWTKVKFK